MIINTKKKIMTKAFLASIVYAIHSTAIADNLGQTTYEIACKNCHAPQLASGLHAPAAFDKKAWAVRFEHAKIEAEKKPARFKSAMDYLLYSVQIGKGLMHHGGLCNEADMPGTQCSNEALIQAIRYMSQN